MLVPISKSPFHVALHHLVKKWRLHQTRDQTDLQYVSQGYMQIQSLQHFFFSTLFPSVRKLLSALKNFSHLQHIMSLWRLHSTTQLSKKNQVERPLVDCSISCSVMGCSQMNSTSLGMSLFCLFYIHVPPVLHRGLLRGWDTDNKICKSKCPLFSSWTWKCQPPYLGS